MECDVYRDLLLDYVGEALAGPDRTALEHHLVGCEACREALEQERQLDEALSRRLVTAPPDGFTGRVLNRVREEGVPRRARDRVLQLAAYAASLAALLAGVHQGFPVQLRALGDLVVAGSSQAGLSLTGLPSLENGLPSWLHAFPVDLGTWLSEAVALEMVRSTGLMGLGIGGALISVLWASYLVLLDSEPAA